MGSAQSTHTTQEVKGFPSKMGAFYCSVSGRKSTGDIVLVEPHMVSTDDEDELDDSSIVSSDQEDSESEDEEEDEEWNERLRILEDCRRLREVAEYFLQPEKPVTVNATACARCLYSRYSAPEQTTFEDAEEASRILAEAQQMKKLAVDYLQPEKPVVTSDPCAMGRNYFTRASAEEQEEAEDAEERAQILADAQGLKKLATDYLHPEKPVVTSDVFAMGRNYFTRPSAEEQEDDAEERARGMEDMKQLKKLAVDYLHPEKPVVTSDPCATGRNYFTRPSAEEYEDEDDADDRDDIMEDMAQLKKFAMDYLHPERNVEIDSLASCRNFFDRPSAPSQELSDEAEERAQILADARALKKLATDYLHPEKPVVTSDAFAMGRNYFSRPSAEQEDFEDAEERARVLEDMKQLKKLAVDYLHPENPVVTSDSCATGRNYFTRSSAEEYEDEDDADDRDDIMEDMAQLKKFAMDYLHPERNVEIDSLASCRNFFDRPSAPTQESIDEAEERSQILADAQQLKKLATDYLHPEKPVVTSDAFAMGRNYFSRPSAEQEDFEDTEERARVLEDMKQLKKLAVDYLHPENPVITSDPFATGRNYFTRPSAEEDEDEAETEERDRILEDMKQLQKLAVDYLHPEKPVITSDLCATGRNYFTRPSAEEYEDEDDADDRDDVMEDMAQLKKLAMDYLHPERSVEIDSLASCRNFFDRPSAPTQESIDEAEERSQILADAQQLKKLASDYLHPEKPVVTSDAFAMGRNYFSRPSAEQEDVDDIEERALVLEDMKQLKKFAVDYLHPEKPVVSSDPFATGRNYFTRPSAEEYEAETEERDRILEDMKQLQKTAVDYLHPEKPVVTSDSCATGRNYFTRPSAEEYEDEDGADDRDDVMDDMAQLKKLAMDYMHPERNVEIDSLASCRNFFDRPSAPTQESIAEAEERSQILADAQQLKKLATDYLHPEKPVVTSDAFAMGRDYFSRPSAEQEDFEDAEERARVLEDMKQLKKLAVDYLHPENPVVTSDPFATGRNYFTRSSAEEYEDEAETEERDRILEDMKQLQKLAVDYLHPEKPVITSDLCATGRNYFMRASAPEQITLEDSMEQALLLEESEKFKSLAVDYLHPEKPVVTTDPMATGRNYFDRPSALGHTDHIHSEGHEIHSEIHHGYSDLRHAEDHGYYHYHHGHDDDSHRQSDHFEMDEDLFHDFRQSFSSVEPFKGEHPKEIIEVEEGNLSRSPSSIMLFVEEGEEGKEGKLSRSPSSIMLFEEAII